MTFHKIINRHHVPHAQTAKGTTAKQKNQNQPKAYIVAQQNWATTQGKTKTQEPTLSTKPRHRAKPKNTRADALSSGTQGQPKHESQSSNK